MSMWLETLIADDDREITPTDKHGVPLLVIPRTHQGRTVVHRREKHHAFHPDKWLNAAEERVLRHGRIQLLPPSLHNAYHRAYRGPRFPETNDDWFKTALLTYAGYVPAEGLQINEDGTFSRVELTAYELGAVANRHLVGPERWSNRLQTLIHRRNAGLYFANHILHQDVSHLAESTIDEFLSTPDDEVYRELGGTLLYEALDVAISPVRPIYEEAHKEGRIIRSRRNDLAGVVTSYFLPRFFPDYFEVIEDQLAA